MISAVYLKSPPGVGWLLQFFSNDRCCSQISHHELENDHRWREDRADQRFDRAMAHTRAKDFLVPMSRLRLTFFSSLSPVELVHRRHTRL